MKLGLYSISYSGLWYDGRPLSLQEVIERAKRYGYEGVSISGKRPHGSPLDMNERACAEVKEAANEAAVELVAIESYTNFMDPVKENREAQLIWLKTLLEMAVQMEIGLVRVFGGWVGVERTADHWSYSKAWIQTMPLSSNHQRWHWIRECLTEAAKWAGDYGVTLALQNHPPPFRAGFEDTLRMVREVDHPNMKMSLDAGLGCMSHHQHTQAYLQQAVEACKDVMVLTHPNGIFSRASDGSVFQEPYDTPGLDPPAPPSGMMLPYEEFIAELKKIDYQGYLMYEVCGPVLRNHNLQGLDEVDRRVDAAADYFKALIDCDVQSSPLV